MLKLLLKTIGRTFYHQHVGLFLVVFYLLFGMIQGYDLILFHKALLLSICSSTLNLCIVYFLWFLYALKSFYFVKQKLNEEAYAFSHQLGILHKKEQIVLWIKVYSFLLAPIFCYAVLMLVTSIAHQYVLSFFATLIMLSLMMLTLATFTYRFNNLKFNTSKPLVNFPSIKHEKPFWSWPIWYLLSEQKIIFFICKLVSFIFFKAILLLFADINNDVRVYLTAMLAVVLSHAIVVLNLTKFDAFYTSFVKNLPILAIKRWLDWFIVFSIILVPEFTVLLISVKITLLQLVYCMLFGVSAMLIMQTIVYFLKADTDKYLPYLLSFFFISMLAILASVYLLFSIAILTISMVIYLWNYSKMDLKEIA